jgi:type I restriction enzyme S subunit
MDKLDDEGEILVYTPETIATRDTDLSTNKYLPDSRRQEMEQFFVEPGDIIFPIVGSLGRAMLIKKNMPEGIINQRLAKFHLSSDKITYPYFMRLFGQSSFFETYIELSCRGSIIVNLTKAILHDMPVPVPPIDEQKRIAAYLDAKCSEINALTADIQSQIDTLEQYKRSVITEAVTKGLDKQAHVKDSGVFYMAPMNENWYLTKIGYICSKLARSFEPEDTALICSNKGKVLIRPEDASGIMVSEDNAMQGIHKGDIAIHGMDTWHGAIALSDYDGKITRVVHVCDSTEDKRFIVYYLQYLAFQGVYKLISNGVRGNTSDFRSWDKVRDIWIAIPKSKSEQKEICDYLDDMCAEIEGTIAIKNDQLSTLYAYKKSIIYEYVTGKKEVPAV